MGKGGFIHKHPLTTVSPCALPNMPTHNLIVLDLRTKTGLVISTVATARTAFGGKMVFVDGLHGERWVNPSLLMKIFLCGHGAAAGSSLGQ